MRMATFYNLPEFDHTFLTTVAKIKYNVSLMDKSISCINNILFNTLKKLELLTTDTGLRVIQA